MKKSEILAAWCAALLAVALMSNSDGVAEHQGKDRTGAPGSQPPCTQCHSNGSFSVNPNVMLTDLDEATDFTVYLPGQTMRLVFTISATGNPSGFGFQATALLANNANAGTFINPSANAQLENVGGRHIVEHNDLSPSNVFTVDWIAPEAGSGAVTVYYSTLAANGNGGTSGDSFSGGSMTFAEGTVSAICASECTNSADGGQIKDQALLWNSSVAGQLHAFNLQGQWSGSWRLAHGTNRIPLSELPKGFVILSTDSGQGLRIWNP